MTLYKCGKCRRWNSGINHLCGDPLPEIRDSNSLKSAVVNAARLVVEEWQEGALQFGALHNLHDRLQELDGLDRPLEH